MIEIKYLFVGQDEYDDVSGYKPTQMNTNEYPFTIAAFIPTRTDKQKNLSEVDSYKRIINMLVPEPLCAKSFDEHKLYSKAGKKVVEHFKDKGVYFCNVSDLKKHFFDGKLINNKWSINSKTNIYLIGSIAINEVISWDISNKTLCLPHPSRHHPLWKKYDLDTKFTKHSTFSKVEKSLNSFR